MSKRINYFVVGLLGILVVVSFLAGYLGFGGVRGLFYVIPLFAIPVVLGKLLFKPETVVSVLLSGFLAFQVGLREESVLLMYILWPAFIILLLWAVHMDKTTFVKLIHIAHRLFHTAGIFAVGILACSYLFIGSSVNTLWNDTVGSGRYAELGYGLTLNASKYFPPSTKLLALEGLQLVDVAAYASNSIGDIKEGREINRDYLNHWTKSGELSEYLVVDEMVDLMDTIQKAEMAGIKPAIDSDVVMGKLSSGIHKLIPIGIGEFLGILYLGYVVLGLVCHALFILLQPWLYRIKYRKMQWLF